MQRDPISKTDRKTMDRKEGRMKDGQMEGQFLVGSLQALHVCTQ